MPGRIRYVTLSAIFLATAVSFADRSMLSITGSAISRDLGLTPVQLGYIFSAFGWSYVAAQVPGGWLLDRFGSKWVYALGILIWSLFTVMQGLVGFLPGGAAVAVLFLLRLLVGLPKRRPFRLMPASWPPGFPATSAARRLPSSTRDNILRP